MEFLLKYLKVKKTYNKKFISITLVNAIGNFFPKKQSRFLQEKVARQYVPGRVQVWGQHLSNFDSKQDDFCNQLWGGPRNPDKRPLETPSEGPAGYHGHEQ
jgi:hypothetical protein